jgi:hypothetical protein
MTPIRTCVGCGERASKQSLLRVVVGANGLTPDPGARAPGRGAYLHRTSACWQQFSRRRGAVRSLRVTPGRGDRDRLVSLLAATGAGL